MSGIIDAVRGMRDVLPGEQRQLDYVRERLRDVLDSHGYARLDLPVVEHRSLYLRKLGEELVGKIYEFRMGGRNLALRPEWTASVLRAYISHMQEYPLPLRLGYSGPVFRYERPQRATYRQFTQLGGELIGGPAPRGDAEVLALACAGLDAVGLHHYYVQLSHIGLVRQMLTNLGLAERTQGLLIWSLERIRTRGVEAMRERLHEAQGDLPIDPSLLAHLDDAQAAELLLHVLETMQVNLSFGTRSPEAIVNRLVRKLRRDDPQPRLDRALDLLGRLSQIRGTPAEALPQARALLTEADLPTTALDELNTVLALLDAHGVPQNRLVVDFGLGRGLNYYTGLIFEIYDQDGNQLCGGGRYDDLVQTLGGRQSVPAVGFTYGLERVAAAATAEAPAPRPEVLVVPIEDDDYTYALEVSQRLRACGFVVTMDVRGRSVTSNLRDAARRSTAYGAIVGASERDERTLVWRDLNTREEQRIALDNIGSLAR
jgi:histidyl-tRNA synthetase